MDRDLDRLAWLALLIVDEAAEQAERGEVVPRTLALRFALAYLCSIADGPTFALPSRRYMFDLFWTTVTNDAGATTRADYSRYTQIGTCKQQIGRQLRYGEGVFNMVRTARSPEAESRHRLAEMIRGSSEERDRKRWRKRQGYFGRPFPGDERKG